MKLIAVVLLLEGFMTLVLADSDPTAWLMYQHDAQRTGRNDFVSVKLPPTLEWKADCFDSIVQGYTAALSDCRRFAVNSALIAYDAAGAFEWLHPIGGEYLILTPKHIAVALSGKGVDVYSYDGRRLRRCSVPSGSRWASAPIGTDGGLIVGSSWYGVDFVDPLRGAWMYPTSGACSNPVQARDGSIYVVTTSGSSAVLCRFDPNGSVIGMPLVGTNSASGVLAFSGRSNLYLLDGNACLHSIDTNGFLNWRTDLGPACAYSTMCLARDGTVYALTQHVWPHVLRLVAVAPSGSILWQINLPGYACGNQYAPIVDSEGKVHVLVPDSSTYVCVSPTGEVLFSGELDYVWGFDFSAHPCLSPGGLVYGLSDGFLYALDADVSGHEIALLAAVEGFAGATMPSVEYDVRLPGSGYPFMWRTVMPETDGTYRLLVPAGTFDITVKPKKWLSALASSVTEGTDMIQLFCRGGDADNNDVVDVLDLNEVLRDFTGYTADVNLDGVTDLRDVTIVLLNFGAVGEGR